MKKMLNTSQDNNFIGNYYASVAKLANALALGASGATLLGSSPSRRTKEKTSERNTTRGKNCCTRCCIEDVMLKTVKGKLGVGLTSKTLVSLRN